MSRTFNGSNTDRLTADSAHVSSGASAFSISAWVSASASGTNKTFYGEARTSTGNPFFQLQTHSGKCRVSLFDDTATALVNLVSSASTIADNTFHHVFYTQDGSGAWGVYIDGTLDATAQGTYSTSTVTITTCSMGYLRSTSNFNFFPGTLAEVATWASQPGAATITKLAAGWPADQFAPDHYWKLDGTSSPEPDTGSSPVSATVTGTTNGASSPSIAILETGAAVAPFTGGGSKVITTPSIKTGSGVAEFSGTGDGGWAISDTGKGVSPFTGGGVRTKTSLKAGSGMSPRVGSGAKVFLPTETGRAVAAFSVHGSKTVGHVYSSSGNGKAVLSGGGVAAPLEHPVPSEGSFGQGISHQWQRSVPSSGVWTDIDHADGKNYTIQNADIGYLIRVVEYDYNYAGYALAPSAATVTAYRTAAAAQNKAVAPMSGSGAEASVTVEKNTGEIDMIGSGVKA